jgi:hypothetical protein
MSNLYGRKANQRHWTLLEADVARTQVQERMAEWNETGTFDQLIWSAGRFPQGLPIADGSASIGTIPGA